jgi:hypothetical protein
VRVLCWGGVGEGEVGWGGRFFFFLVNGWGRWGYLDFDLGVW